LLQFGAEEYLNVVEDQDLALVFLDELVQQARHFESTLPGSELEQMFREREVDVDEGPGVLVG